MDVRIGPTHHRQSFVRPIRGLGHLVITVVIPDRLEISIRQNTRISEYLRSLHFGEGHFCFAVCLCLYFVDHVGVLG